MQEEMQEVEAEKTFWREIAGMYDEDPAEMLNLMTTPGKCSAEWLAAQSSNEADADEQLWRDIAAMYGEDPEEMLSLMTPTEQCGARQRG